MCGLAGMLTPSVLTDADRRAVAAMAEAVADRGPDGFGRVESQGCLLAHRRLAIRDASGGRQPMASPCGRVHLVYNGELYNDAALRAELGGPRGHGRQPWATRCDTETVLAAYLRWGVDCLPHLQGMFALAIYDARDRSLLLARDRCGVKPLFYATAGGGLVFASTVAAVLEHPQVSRQPDFAAMSHYLGSFRLTLGRRTLYDGIRQISPGERLVARDGRVRLDRWNDVPTCHHDSVETARPDRDQLVAAADELEARLTDAVDRRLVSDVPVGLLLSGGVDSAVLASMLRDRCGASMLAMGAGEQPGGVDDAELASARATAAELGLEFEPVVIDDASYVRTWEELLGRTRLPLATPSDIPIHQLAVAMKARVGVVLGGEGADELLGGYALPHFAARDFHLASDRSQVRPSAWPGFVNSLQRATGKASFPSLTDHFLSVNSIIPPAAKAAMWQPDVWDAAHRDEPVRAYYAGLLGARSLGSATPQRRVYRALMQVNLEGQLARLDSSTMLAGLEARVPYCDGELIDRIAPLPWSMHLGLRPGERQPFRAAAELMADNAIESKRLLRAVAARRLPSRIARRPKASFPTPAARLLGGVLAGEVTALLKTSRFARQLFDPSVLAAWADAPAAAGMMLWPVVNLVRWGEREFFGGAAHGLGAPTGIRVAAPERSKRTPAESASLTGATQTLRAIR